MACELAPPSESQVASAPPARPSASRIAARAPVLPQAPILVGDTGLRRVVNADAIHAHGLGDVLDLLLAQEVEAQLELALNRVENRARYADTAPLSQRLQAGRNVHAITVDRSVALLDHIAQVHADPKLHAACWRELQVPTSDDLLDLARALHGFYRARKVGEDVVAGRVDDAALVACNHARNSRAVLDQRGYRRLLVVAHQTRVADHVGAQDRCELAFALSVSQQPLPVWKSRQDAAMVRGVAEASNAVRPPDFRVETRTTTSGGYRSRFAGIETEVR